MVKSTRDNVQEMTVNLSHHHRVALYTDGVWLETLDGTWTRSGQLFIDPARLRLIAASFVAIADRVKLDGQIN